MPRNYQPVEFNTFVGGLVTEASPLNFPTNASLDEENFVLNKDGTRSRRLGMQFEPGYNIINSTSSLVNSELVVSSFKWSNAGGLSTNTIICVQMGNTIDFFKGNAQTISPSKFFSYTFTGLNPVVKFSYASVDGKLIVVTGQKQVWLFAYDVSNPNPATAISVTSKRLLIRDFFGLDDGNLRIGTGISTRPASATGQHIYNLRNQGWAVPRPQWGGNDGTADVISAFTGASGGAYPSNADNITSYIYANTASTAGSKTVERFDAQNIVSNPPSNTEAPIGYFIIDALDRGNSRQAAVADMASKYPTNSAALNSTITAALKLDETPGGPTCICEYAGRIWYAGFPGSVNAGDLHSPKLNAYLMFSQLVNDEGDINLCYQAADPTDPHSPDLVDTDGGFIRVEGAYGIVGMATLQSTLFVLAENGVWAVSGGSSGGFTATNYQVSKLTDAGCISTGSIVVMQDSIFYWGMDGIYSITRNEFGDFRSNNITNKTIKRFYMAIPNESIKKAEGVYDSYDGYVKWLYNNYLDAGDDPIELNLDVNSGAYFKLRIKPLTGGYPLVIKGVPTDPYRISVNINQVVDSLGNTVVTTDSSTVIVNSSQQISGLKEITYLTLTDDSHYTFSGYTEPYHFDWTDVDGVGADAYAYLLTGVLSGGDYQRGKQIVYQTTHFGKTETGVTPLILTSRPYPLDTEEDLLIGFPNNSGILREILHKEGLGDNVGLNIVINSGSLRDVHRSLVLPPESISVNMLPTSGVLMIKPVPKETINTTENTSISVVPTSGLLKQSLIRYTNWLPESVSIGILPTDGNLSVAGDPYWSNVSSLLHFDGADGGSTFTDEVSGNVWTPSTNAKTSTANKRFGTASFYPLGGGWISSQNDAKFGFGSGDYTIEGWVLSGVGGDRAIFDNRSASNQGIGIYCSTSSNNKLAVASNSAVIATGTTTIGTTQFLHWAVTRSSGTLRGFLNGVQEFSVSDTRTLASSAVCYYGSNYLNSQLFASNLDECRITKGVARYTSNFTPPTSPFYNHS